MGSRDRVAEYLGRSGVRFELREFGESTRSSLLAAQALGCTVAEIAKSVVFIGDRTAVVITSGDKRVSLPKLSTVIRQARMASPDEVRQRTGFPIGGVPPFPHGEGVAVLPDVSLTRFSAVWAAAGAPNAVFRMASADVLRLVGAGPFDLCE